MQIINEDSLGAGAGFAVLAVGVAAALVPFRTELGGTNVAIILLILVVGAAAVGGRTAGVVAGLTAAVSFNFFHTKPYLTLRVDDFKDMVTIALIMVIGFAVGELAVARSRQSAARRSHLRAVHTLEEVSALISSGADVTEVWAAVQDGMMHILSLRSVSFESDTSTSLPTIERDGRVNALDHRFVGTGFVLPANGAAVSVDAGDRHLGRLVVVPDSAVGVTREERRAAIALADQLAIALRNAPPIHSLT